ncbi:N2,N2-dimethylguanosine trna methyltransferase, partial [Nosema bombycis CQ1]
MNENCIIEGEAQITKYSTTFYNPAQKTNRDISVAVIREYFKDKESIRVLDAMSATGLRGIRYSKEIKNTKLYFNDVSPHAVQCIKENLQKNGVHEIGEFSENYEKIKDSEMRHNIIRSDCNRLMCSLTGFFDVIDIDPFGGCSLYIENAFRAIKHNGLLCFTCTDKGALCVNEDKCFVKYSTTILKGFSKHETPLRVILSLISRQASKFGISIEPLVSLSLDFYIRVFVRVRRNRPKDSIRTNSMFYLCKCSNSVEIGSIKKTDKEDKVKNVIETDNNLINEILRSKLYLNDSDICSICNSKMKLCGPFWNTAMHKKEFVKALISHDLDARSQGILKFLLHEIDKPFYYEMTTLCARTKFSCIKLKDILYGLENLSFNSS